MKYTKLITLYFLLSGFTISTFAGPNDSFAQYSDPFVFNPISFDPHTLSIKSPDPANLQFPLRMGIKGEVSTPHLLLPSDYSPPSQAVFCRFENTLGRTFGIGLRLRVEQPPEK